jgi:outer membrane protein, heavy metal efflux system
MCLKYLMRLTPAVAVGLASCVSSARVRQHDAMAAAVARATSERGRTGPVDVSSLVVDGALDRAAVIAAVLARNPDLDAARAAWRAAVAAFPSAVSLDDPVARYALAPFSVGSEVPLGQRIEISQKLPWPGKRELRGDAALADAEAAQHDVESLRVDLAEAAVQAFDDNYIAARALEINQHHRELLERIERSALAQYTAGRGSQQDSLEAHAHIIELDRERLMLEKQRRIAITTLNRLMHRKADAELPPPPARLVVARSADTVREHPKQAAATARMRARQADIEQADRAFYPDFEVMGSYDSM